ncbi:Uncharacterized protein APZ42_025062 [Daphnia magna]|uniref:Uncharacterized protein n=1 Tax=Daphnia magna TaxID=35525 RepID=A0A164THX1_9CRUS|nr:Uncharacterized protein APZ42_025062 [Daphnia magna]
MKIAEEIKQKAKGHFYIQKKNLKLFLWGFFFRRRRLIFIAT